MTPEIVSIFAALIIHITVYYFLLIIIDIKHAGGSARDAFSCFKVNLKAKPLLIGSLVRDVAHDSNPSRWEAKWTTAHL